MNCQSARAVITRYMNGDRKPPVANMIGSASAHLCNCREDGCVRAQMKLDQLASPARQSEHAQQSKGP